MDRNIASQFTRTELNKHGLTDWKVRLTTNPNQSFLGLCSYQVKLITLECFHIIKKVLPKATPFESMVSNDWKPEIKQCKHEWNKNQCEKCGEFKLYGFQVIGAKATEIGLASQRGFGIFDDMGLGKACSLKALVATPFGFRPMGT